MAEEYPQGDSIINSKTVSVIIPAHNAEHCIGACIDSVMAQSLKPIEIIVVDDGSQDATCQVVSIYGNAVQLIRQNNQGAASARNKGVELSSGEFIAFLDADDYWLDNFLLQTVRFLDATPHVIAVLTAWQRIFVNGKRESVPEILNHSPSTFNRPHVIENLFESWVRLGHVQTGAILLRAETVKKVGGMLENLRVSQDVEYWAYLATFGKWGFIPDILYANNSRVAAAVNWIAKYSIRRKLCPTVEEWQERIVPRLSDSQWPYFKVIRGRVAAGYAQNHILGGNPDQARYIVRNYGHEMPDNRLTCLLKIGNRLGAPGWRAACLLVLGREYAKAAGLRLRFSGKGSQP